MSVENPPLMDGADAIHLISSNAQNSFIVADVFMFCYTLIYCRQNHRFVTAPNARLLRKILSLCSSRMVTAESALHIACELASGQLHVPLEDLADDATEMERALEAANILVDVLDFASSQLDDLTKAGHKR